MNKSDVFYQIYPLSFNDSNGDGYGDLNGIIEKISYLKKLGIDWVWISSHWDSPMADFGYDIKDYLNVNPLLGNLDDFKLLIKKFHDNNLKLITDAVFDHTSTEHKWFKSALKNETKYRDYYFWTDQPNLNLKNVTGELSYTYIETVSKYYLHMFNKRQADLNWMNDNLRQDIYSIMNQWIDWGVDGFRFDVLDMIAKVPAENVIVNGPKLHDYIREMNINTFGKRKDFFTVGECWSAGLNDIQLYSNPLREEITSVFALNLFARDFSENGQWKLKSYDLDNLREKLMRYQNAKNVIVANVLSNHDIPRFVSRVFPDDCKNYWADISMMMMGILLTLNGVPFIYQGEEIGMIGIDCGQNFDYQDNETIIRLSLLSKESKTYFTNVNNIKKGSRDNSRTMMQWDKSQFDKHYWIEINKNVLKINANSQINDKNSVFNWTKNLIKLRKNLKYCKKLCEGSYLNLEFNNKQLFGYKKFLEDEKNAIYVITNWSNENIDINFDLGSIIMSNNYEHVGNKLNAFGIVIFTKIVYS